VLFQPLDDELARAFGLDHKRGAVVTNVSAGSPAADAGMRTGDVIVEVSGVALESGRHLPSTVASLDPGAEVAITVVRNGKRRELQVVIGELPEDRMSSAKPRPESKRQEHGDDRLGLAVVDLDDTMRKRLGSDELEHGVVVVQLEPGGLAARALEKGDVIVEVNRDPVRSVEEFERHLAQLGNDDDMLMLVHRDGSWLYVVIRL
jgi:serine protease Do